MNTIMMKKENGKWWICIDFTDLNWKYPKDGYPLPRINQIVDATPGYDLVSFIDAFSSYSQIRMAAPKDEKKMLLLLIKDYFH